MAPFRIRKNVPYPPRVPIATAEKVLKRENSSPRVPAVTKNIDGYIKREESQKAITGAKGTPMLKSAAINGITPQEQNGESPPISEAKRIITDSLP